jgi:TonB family protein
MMQSPVAPAAEGTVVMQAPVAAPAPPADSTLLMGAAVAVPKAPAPPPPPPAKAPSAPAEGTVVMPSPAGLRGTLAHFADDPSSAAPAAPRVGAPGRSGPTPAPPRPTATAAMPPIDPPRKTSIAPLAIAGGGAGLLVLAAVVAGAWWFLSHRRADVTPTDPTPEPVATVAAATPTPPPPAVQVKGTLHVETEPTGATVTINGEPRGETPLEVADLFLGNHEVKVELRGYAAVTQTVVLSEDSPRSELKLPLSKAAPVMGAVDILSTPAGATVKIDGTGVGQTPLHDFGVKVGKHEVEIVKEGHEPWTSPLTVRRGKSKLEAQLRPVARPTPVPVVSDVPDPNKVYDQSDVDTPPKQTQASSASYPRDAPKLKSGDSVSVAGTFVVNANGEVDATDIQIKESGGPAVDKAVRAALAKRKYTPGVKKGVKVKVRVPFRQTFQAS